MVRLIHTASSAKSPSIPPIFLSRHSSHALKDAISQFGKLFPVSSRDFAAAFELLQKSSSTKKKSGSQTEHLRRKYADLLKLLVQEISLGELTQFFNSLRRDYFHIVEEAEQDAQHNKEKLLGYILQFFQMLFQKESNFQAKQCILQFMMEFTVKYQRISQSSPIDHSQPFLDILRRNPKFIHSVLDQFNQLLLETCNVTQVWNRFALLVSYVFSSHHLTSSLEEELSRKHIEMEDSQQPLDNDQEETPNSQTTSSISQINTALVDENRVMQTFYTKSYFVKGITRVALCFSQSDKLASEARLLFLRLFQLLPTLDLHASESDISMFCMKPTEEILNLFFLLAYKSHSEEESTQLELDLREEFVPHILSHLFSLLLELNSLYVRSQGSLDLVSCLQLIYRVVTLAPEHASQYLHIVSHQLIQCKTYEELHLTFLIFREIIHHLHQCQHDPHSVLFSYSKEYTYFSLQLALVALLHVMSHQEKELHNEATQLLPHLEKLLLPSTGFQCTWKLLDVKRDANPKQPTIFKQLCSRQNLNAFTNGLHVFVHQYYTLDHDSQSIVPHASLLNWIRNIKQRMQHMPSHTFNPETFSSPELFFLVVGTVFYSMRQSACEDRRVVLRIMSLCSSINSLISGLIFQPLLSYELSFAKTPQEKLELLYTIPTLGTQHPSGICIKGALRLINALSKSLTFLPVALRMMLLLWKENDRFFPKLKHSLLQASKYGTSSLSSFSYNTRLAVADTILRVCEFNAHRGLRLITVLSQILCQETDTHILSLSVRSMRILCSEELLDFFTAWFNIVSENVEQYMEISDELRAEVCRLFSCATREYYIDDEEVLERKGYKDADLEFESDYRHEVRDIVLQLFSCTGHSSESVREAAAYSLSQFPLPALLFALSDEPSDEDEPAQVQQGDSDEQPAAEDLLAKRNELLEMLSTRLTNILQSKPSKRVLDALSPLLLRIMKTELVKPIGSGSGSTLQRKKQIASERKKTPAHHLLKNFLDFVYAQKTKLRNIMAPNLLWCSNERAPKRKQLEFYDAELHTVISTVNVTEGSMLGIGSHNLLFQGYLCFLRSYFSTAVAAMQKKYHKQLKKGEKVDSRQPYSMAFHYIFDKLVMELQTNEVRTSANVLCALGALAMALPSHSHQNVEHITRAIATKLSDAGNLIHSDWWLYNAHIALVACSFETHVESDLDVLFNRYSNVLHDVASSMSVSGNFDSLTDCLDSRFMSSALCLGLLTKNICLSSAVVLDNQAQGASDSKEKQQLFNVVRLLFGFCFPHRPFLQQPSFIEAHFSTVQDDDHLFFSKRMDNTQVNALFLGLAHCTDALARCQEKTCLVQIYEALWATITHLVQDLENKSVFFGENKQTALERGKIFLGALSALPIVAEQVYRLGKTSLASQWLDTLDHVQKNTQKESSSLLQKIFIASSSAKGSLIFRLLRSGFSYASVGDMANHLQEVRDRVESTQNVIERISLIMYLAGLLGSDWTTPIPMPKMIDFDDTYSYSLESIYDSFDVPLEKTTASLKRILMNDFHDAKHRVFTGLTLGSLSELYRPRESMDMMTNMLRGQTEGASSVPLSMLTANGISMYFVHLLESDTNKMSISLLQLGTQLLLSNEYLPQIRYGETLSSIMQTISTERSSAKKPDSLLVETLVLCLRLLSKDARSASGKSSSLRILSDLCEKNQMGHMSQHLFAAVLREIPHLTLTFPTSRAQKFLVDCCQLVFFSQHSLDVRGYSTKLSLLKSLRVCVSNKLPNEVYKTIHEQLDRIKLSLPDCITFHAEDRIDIALPVVLILKEWAAVAADSPLQSQVLGAQPKQQDISLNDCIIRACASYHDASQENVTQILSPLRDYCCSSRGALKHEGLIFLVSSMVADAMLHMDHRSRLRWIETSLNALSFHMSGGEVNQNIFIFLSMMLSSWSHAEGYFLYAAQDYGFVDYIMNNESQHLIQSWGARGVMCIQIDAMLQERLHSAYLIGELLHDQSISQSSVHSLLDQLFGRKHQRKELQNVLLEMAVNLRSHPIIRNVFSSSLSQEYIKLVMKEASLE